MDEEEVFSVRTEPVTSGEDKDKSFYENPEVAAHVHGDALNFSGEPSDVRGNIWEALDINLDSLIPKCIEKNEIIGPFNILHTDAKIIYLDSPPKVSPLQIRFVAEEGKENYLIKDLYPLMQGHPTDARLKAWFDVAEDDTGYLSTELSNGIAMDFFAPSYVAMRPVFSEDAEYELYISGVAILLEKAPFTKFEVKEGELYNRKLEKFLKDNPGKTAADFSPPVVSLERAVGCMPTKYTCEWEVFGTVLEVSEYSFENIPYYRLLMPIARSSESDDVLAYIYVGKKFLKDYEPKKGDLIQGIMWLCADFGNKE